MVPFINGQKVRITEESHKAEGYGAWTDRAGLTTHFQDLGGTAGPRGRGTGHSNHKGQDRHLGQGGIVISTFLYTTLSPDGLHQTPPCTPVHPFGPPGLTERLRECWSGRRQSRARAGGRGRCARPGSPWADALAGVVLHHLPGHLSQDTLSKRRGCGLGVGAGTLLGGGEDCGGRGQARGRGFGVARWAPSSLPHKPSTRFGRGWSDWRA